MDVTRQYQTLMIFTSKFLNKFHLRNFLETSVEYHLDLLVLQNFVDL